MWSFSLFLHFCVKLNPCMSWFLSLLVLEWIRGDQWLKLYLQHFGKSSVFFCTGKDRTEQKLLGFSYLRLSADDSTTVYDGLHELHLHKVCFSCTVSLNVTEVYYCAVLIVLYAFLHIWPWVPCGPGAISPYPFTSPAKRKNSS